MSYSRTSLAWSPDREYGNYRDKSVKVRFSKEELRQIDEAVDELNKGRFYRGVSRAQFIREAIAQKLKVGRS